MGSAVGRLGASLAGLAAFAAGLWVLLLALIVGGPAAQRPDPAVPDGDPCCGHPDDWWEVALGLGGGAWYTAIALGLLYVASVAMAFGLTGRIPVRVTRHLRAHKRLAFTWLALVAGVALLWLPW